MASSVIAVLVSVTVLDLLALVSGRSDCIHPESSTCIQEGNSLLQVGKNRLTSSSRPGQVALSIDHGVQKLLSQFGLPADSHEDEAHDAARKASSIVLLDNGQPTPGMFSLPPLPYDYSALEPHIDAATMKFHHDFHHKAYIDKLNAAMAGKPKASLLSLMPGAKTAKLNNAGGGHYNHCMFWTIMGPQAGGAPTGVLAEKIDAAFGSYDNFKSNFSAAAVDVFGSGWAWLVVAGDGSVKIVTTPNQDNPLMEGATEAGLIPIMGIDVWEHAYYLKYQNRRPEYIDAFYNVINWEKVGEYYATAASGSPLSFDS